MSDSPAGKKAWSAGTLTYSVAGLALLFFWLLWGDFAWTLKQRAVDPVAQLLMRSHEASNLFIGLMVGSLPNALGMFIGPVVAVKSDRHRGRWGRRIPFLLMPTPFAAIAMVGVAFSPTMGRWLDTFLAASSPGPHACVLIVFSLFWLVFEALTTISNTVFGALINDVVPAEFLGRFLGLFRAVGLLAGIIFNVFLMGKAEEYAVPIFIGLALIYAVGFTMMCMKVKEGEYPPPPPAAPQPWIGFTQYLRECFANPYYLRVVVALAVGGLALGPVNSFSVLYAKEIGVSMQNYGYCQAVYFTFSLVLAYPIGALADRFHPLRLSIATMLVYAAVMLAAFFLVRSPWTFEVFFVLHGALSGAYYTSSASLAQRLFPKDRFAQFASSVGIVAGILYMIMPPALGAFIDAVQRQYSYSFLLAGILSFAAVGFLWHVHGRFVKLGGPENYTAPAP